MSSLVGRNTDRIRSGDMSVTERYILGFTAQIDAMQRYLEASEWSEPTKKGILFTAKALWTHYELQERDTDLVERKQILGEALESLANLPKLHDQMEHRVVGYVGVSISRLRGILYGGQNDDLDRTRMEETLEKALLASQSVDAPAHRGALHLLASLVHLNYLPHSSS